MSFGPRSTIEDRLMKEVSALYQQRRADHDTHAEALWAVYQAGRKGLRGPDDVLAVLEEIARKHGLRASDLREKRTMVRAYARARFELWYELFTRLDMPKIEIGRWHGYNHASVIHGIREHERLLAELENARRSARRIGNEDATDAADQTAKELPLPTRVRAA